MTQRSLFPFALLTFSLLLLENGVVHGEEPIQPADPMVDHEVTFYRDIFPILQAKCLACHSAAVKESDLILETPEATIKGGASGAAVALGKPDESQLYLVSARIEEPHMPPVPNKAQAKPLTPREVGLLRKWIQEGAKPGDRQASAQDIAWQPVPESFKATYSMAMTGNQEFLAVGRGNRIFMYDLARGIEVTRLSDPALLSIQKNGQPLYGPGVAQRDFVHNLAFSANGQLLASADYRCVKLWERLPSAVTSQWKGDAAIRTVAISAPHSLAAIVTEANAIQFWNMSTGAAGMTIAGGESPVRAVGFAADGVSIVVASDDARLRTFTVADGQPLATVTLPSPVTALAVRPNHEVLAGHADNVIRRWAWPMPVAEGAEPPQPLAELPGHGGAIKVLSILASGAEMLSGSADGTVRLWNLDNNQASFNQNLGAPVTGIAHSNDGNTLAAAAENGLARVWAKDGKQKAEVKGNSLLDGKVAVLTDDQTVSKSRAALAETARAEAEKDLKEREESLKKSEEQVVNAEKDLGEVQKKVDEAEVAAKAAAEALAGKADDEALKKAKEEADKKLTEATTERDKKKDAVTSAKRGVEISMQSVALGKMKLDERVKQKETEEAAGKVIDEQLTAAKDEAGKAITAVRGVSLTGDGLILTTAGDNGLIQQWNASTGAALDVISTSAATVKFLSAIDDQTLVSFGDPSELVVRDVSPRWQLKKVIGGTAEDPLDISKSPFTDRVLALAFNHNGTLLAVGGGEPSRSGELMIFSTETGELVSTFADAHSDTVYDLAFSRDGKQLVSGAADKFVKLFDVESGKLIRAYEGHTNHVLGVAIQADGSTLSSAGADNAIKVWNTETGEQKRTITSHSKQVTSVEYIGLTENIVSSGGDMTVRAHKSSNGQNYRNFGGAKDYLYRAAAFGDESVVIAVGEDGDVRLWNGKDGNLLKSFPAPAPVETAAK